MGSIGIGINWNWEWGIFLWPKSLSLLRSLPEFPQGSAQILGFIKILGGRKVPPPLRPHCPLIPTTSQIILLYSPYLSIRNVLLVSLIKLSTLCPRPLLLFERFLAAVSMDIKEKQCLCKFIEYGIHTAYCAVPEICSNVSSRCSLASIILIDHFMQISIHVTQ